MATSVGKKFNWVQRPTAWQFAQAWNNQRAQMAAKFREQNDIAVNGFATAQYNNITGFVANAQTAAINRLKKSV
jgi:catabolite regulation protein CreA